jgi:uncharacterized protein (TIGR03067 family)
LVIASALLGTFVLIGCRGATTTEGQQPTKSTDSTALPRATEAEVKKALDELQGSWEVTKRVKEGEEMDVKGVTVIFEKDKMTIKKPELADQVNKIAIDPGQHPARFDMLFGHTSKAPGIYELVGDEMKFNLTEIGKGTTPPSDFAPTNSTELYVMKRMKAPK